MSEETKKLLMTYSVLNSDYGNAKLMRIEGTTSGGPNGVDTPPTNTGYPVADASDPMVYSYIGANDEVHLLVVRTQAGSPEATTYTVLHRITDPETNTDTWDVYNDLTNIKFELDVEDENGVKETISVLGNPQSLAQVKVGTNRFIYLVDFDSSWVYGINVADFEAHTPTSNPYLLTPSLCVDLTDTIDPFLGYPPHGISIIALQESEEHFLFALYMAVDDPWNKSAAYNESTVVKLLVGAGGVLTNPPEGTVKVGANATGLVPVNSEDGISILVPAIGGPQQYGDTNGPESKLHLVPTSLASAPVALEGAEQTAGPLDEGDTYDIRMAAASADGSYIYILTGTFSQDYNMFWRLYKFTLDELKSYSARSLDTVADHAIESGARALGYYWSVLYETSAGPDGRLWFVRGSPIQITVGTNYASANRKEIRIGEDELGGTNVNSVDLTGEMVALAATDKPVNTLLRAYQPPHVVSGAFRSMADFIRHEKVRKLHQERLEKKRGKRKDKQGASKVVTLQPKVTAPKLTLSIDPKVLKAKIDVTVSFDSKDASPKIEVTAAQ
ncbi:MAG: hypothetical protein LBG24_10925 [Treponema sp.]|jgi:Arc/MetJ-type ribon-helix-helix transcriptional regulator|nr:hypothetical protein [Treponema sp.]